MLAFVLLGVRRERRASCFWWKIHLFLGFLGVSWESLVVLGDLSGRLFGICLIGAQSMMVRSFFYSSWTEGL